jgi:hypothetical protein
VRSPDRHKFATSRNIVSRVMKDGELKYPCTTLIFPSDGLGPKSLRGNRFYKGHRQIAEKASQNF